MSALQSLGAMVIGADRAQAAADASDAFIACDIFDQQTSLISQLDSMPDACLHLAWRNGFDHNSVSHMMDLSKHFAFLDQLIDSGIPQVACMGSMHEVGYWEGAVNDATPCNPQSYYGIAKDALRRAFLLKAQKADIVAQWFRGFYIYGDDEASQSIFGKLVRAAKEGQKTFPFTSGEKEYDFLPINEFAHQIACCVMQTSIDGVINCCSGHSVPLGEQVESFIQENNLDITLEYGAYPDRPYDSPAIWGDGAKIKEVLRAQEA